jgi:putative addiction module CopG family antidote
MSLQLPIDLQQLVDHQLATGLYAKPDDVLRDALHLLIEHQGTVDDLKASIEDIDAGRVSPLADVLAEIRQRHGWPA